MLRNYICIFHYFAFCHQASNAGFKIVETPVGLCISISLIFVSSGEKLPGIIALRHD